jgi:hypothetical protein
MILSFGVAFVHLCRLRHIGCVRLREAAKAFVLLRSVLFYLGYLIEDSFKPCFALRSEAYVRSKK